MQPRRKAMDGTAFANSVRSGPLGRKAWLSGPAGPLPTVLFKNKSRWELQIREQR